MSTNNDTPGDCPSLAAYMKIYGTGFNPAGYAGFKRGYDAAVSEQPARQLIAEEGELRIVAAAVMHKGVVHTAPHHHLAMWQISCCWGEKATGEQGFVASDGKFYGREESYVIATWAKQIKFPLPYVHDDLYSEELWSYAGWLKDRKMADHPDAILPAPSDMEAGDEVTHFRSLKQVKIPTACGLGYFVYTDDFGKKLLEERHVLPSPSGTQAAIQARDRIAMHEELPDFDVAQLSTLLHIIRQEFAHFEKGRQIIAAQPSPAGRSDTERLEWLDSIPSREKWGLKVAHGCVFLCRNSSSGADDVRAAIDAAMSPAGPTKSEDGA